MPLPLAGGYRLRTLGDRPALQSHWTGGKVLDVFPSQMFSWDTNCRHHHLLRLAVLVCVVAEAQMVQDAAPAVL